MAHIVPKRRATRHEITSELGAVRGMPVAMDAMRRWAVRRPLIIAASVALAMCAIDSSQSPASAQTATTRAPVATPLPETLTATHTLPNASPARPRAAWDREPRGLFRVHDRHWSWLFPRTAVAPFGSDPLQRRHWWADPLLRRHRWD